MRLILLLGVPALFLILFESALRISGFGYPTAFFLPVTINGKSMKIQNDRFTWRFLGREMARQPFPMAIPSVKAPGTIRIFVLGESAAYGDPQPEFGLARMLEALLSGRFPETRFEVVNAGITAINSQVVLPLAEDCARENGDVWVIYMGNNEVVGPFGAGTVFGSAGASRALIQASLALKSVRSGQLLDGLVSRLKTRPNANREWGGMAMFMQNQVSADDPRMRSVYEHFTHNLQGIMAAGRRHGVKVAIGTVVSNLKDCAPFASLHRRGLGRDELNDWNLAYGQGMKALKEGRPAEASESFRRASGIDGSFADLDFAWGKASLALGRQSEALDHFTRARDEDALRFRADSHLNRIIRDQAKAREAEGIGLVDAEQMLAAQSAQGVVGNEFLYEHVHLNFEGNYLLGRAFAEEVTKLVPDLRALVTKNLQASWPSGADCAKRLGLTDWHRYQARSEILSRIADAPFTGQLNHQQQHETARSRLEQLRAATAATALHRAEDLCRNAIARFPDDWILEKDLATILERLGDYPGVAECWRTIVRLLPDYSEAWQHLGQALAEQNQNQPARAAFERAVQLDPDSIFALTGLAETFSREGRTTDALRYYARILKLKPYWGPAHLGIGKALEALGRKEEAQPHFRLALENRIYTPVALKGLAKLCFDRGWFSEAAANFGDALKLDPLDPSTEVNLGLTLALLDRHPEAQRHYAEAVRLDPDLAEAHVRLGFELGRQGDDAAALDHFAKAVELKPELLEARLDLGIALVNQHRQSEALLQFQEVLKRSPTNAIASRYLQKLTNVR